MKSCLVIGGGIVGLSTAYFLHREGHHVTLIDMSDLSTGASFVNAGYLTPSHIIPLAAPGMVAKGLQMMLNSTSPFYIKLRADKDLLMWMWQFYKSANATHVRKSLKPIAEINLLSRRLYEEIKAENIFSFQLDPRGILNIFQSNKNAEYECRVAEWAQAEGLEARVLNRNELNSLEPHFDLQAQGAVWYKCDAHMTPGEFMKGMHHYLESSGVKIFTHTEVTDFKVAQNAIQKVVTPFQSFSADEVVLASGSWSPLLLQKLGLKLSLQAGKGYSINVYKVTNIQYPAILTDAKVAVTPMLGFTRFAGTMELSGINHHIRRERVEAIAQAAEKFYPGLQIPQNDKDSVRCGLRPVSPDGLPYIGRVQKINNLTVATGHAMMGWSMGPATGKLVSEIIGQQKLSMDISPFRVERKF